MTHALEYRLFRGSACLAVALAAALAVALSGCAAAKKVANVVEGDAATAAALARSDTISPAVAALRAGCYQSIGAIAGSLSAAQTLGVLALTEAGLQGQELAQSPNCQAVAGAMLVNLMQQQKALLGPAGLLIP